MTEETPKADEKSATESYKETVDRQEKANEEMKKLNEEKKELLATERLHGTTDAGEPAETEKKEETAAEYKDKVMSGKVGK